MVNAHRGEIEAELDGQRFKLCLTLSALAELEHTFGVDDMTALAARFESGRISSSDCMRILGAGLRGGGHDISNDDVAMMKSNLGAAGFVDIVVRLLTATFGAAEQISGQHQPRAFGDDKGEEREAAPFPGKM